MQNITSLTEKELAREINVSLSKLRQDRYKGKGFPWVRLGDKAIRYRLTDVLEYLKEQNSKQEYA